MSTRAGGAGEPDTGDAFFAALLEDDPEELYENAPCAYLSVLPDGTVAKANETFLRWTGYDRGDLIGARRFQDLLPPGDHIFYETHLAPLLRMQGQLREVAVEIQGAAGARLSVLMNAAVKHAPDGTPVMVRIAMLDATERRSYENELLAARRRAEDSEARASALARTLQASFLPPTEMSIRWVDVAGAYRPAGDGTEVGGDFYDVFETEPGRWAVVLGDVCGKGATAAVLTGLAKHTARSAAIHADRPSAILASVHDSFVRYHPEQYCTALCLLVHPSPRGAEVAIASGGHALPARVDRDGNIDTVGAPGTILGLVDEPDLTDVTVVLAPREALVLFTDGVTEARRNGDFFDDERLNDVISQARAASAQGIADRIISAALDYQGNVARDDMAVVVLKARGSAVTSR